MTDLTSLGKLLDFGAMCMEHQNIKIPRLRGVKKVFFPMLVAAHNYTEGVFSLCKENRSHPSFALLRPLCENLINARFLFCNRRKHTHVIFLDSLLEKKKQLDHALTFLKQNPNRFSETNMSIKDIEKTLKKIATQEKKVKARIKKFSGNLIMDTLGRARHVDKYNDDKHIMSTSLEWIYILIFRSLSSHVHIKSHDFKNYFKLVGSEIIVFLSGNVEEIGEILQLADYFYKELLRTFLKLFKSPLLKKFEKSFCPKLVS
ncbi:MAG: hypothetical protein KF898_00885 [Parachlamydiales bacterium]|nr:hypothetical protein [Verrucomicrobiota bacterium]MBX3718184.1 hypothetical protein [Candidatus Acheromyda pituitae]